MMEELLEPYFAALIMSVGAGFAAGSIIAIHIEFVISLRNMTYGQTSFTVRIKALVGEVLLVMVGFFAIVPIVIISRNLPKEPVLPVVAGVVGIGVVLLGRKIIRAKKINGE